MRDPMFAVIVGIVLLLGTLGFMTVSYGNTHRSFEACQEAVSAFDEGMFYFLTGSTVVGLEMDDLHHEMVIACDVVDSLMFPGD